MTLIVRRVFCFLLLFFTLASVPMGAYSVRLTSNTSSKELLKAQKVLVEEAVNLNGTRLILGDHATLVFKGGSIINGEIVFKNTELYGEIKLYCHVSGTILNKTVYVDWFLPQNDLDVLYGHGVFNLKGYEELIFLQPEYVSGVRGKNNGIRFNNVVVEGNGATIYAKEGGSTINSLLVFSECNNIAIKNLVLRGKETPSNEEGARHNLCLNKCNNTTVENVVSYDAFTDGLYIRKCNDVKVQRFAAYRSGRQGCSLTAGTNICFDGCIFDGSYRVAPKSGFDIEPNYSTDPINNIIIKNCSFTNNAAAGLTVKLHQGEKERQCNITVDSCFFDGNAANISLRSAPNSGKGEIEIKNCTLKNSKGVSFQSKCYSAYGTPVVLFHNSKLDNANTAGGGDVREQATFISVHNISSNPLQGDFGNIQLYDLSIKQDKKHIKKLRRVLNLYPDEKWSISNVMIRNITIDVDREDDKYFRKYYIPNKRVSNVKVN